MKNTKPAPHKLTSLTDQTNPNPVIVSRNKPSFLITTQPIKGTSNQTKIHQSRNQRLPQNKMKKNTSSCLGFLEIKVWGVPEAQSSTSRSISVVNTSPDIINREQKIKIILSERPKLERERVQSG